MTSTFPLKEHDRVWNQQSKYRRRIHFLSKYTIDLEINNWYIDDVYFSSPRTRSSWKSTIEISTTSKFPVQEHVRFRNYQSKYRRRLHFLYKNTIDLEINNRNIEDVYISSPRTWSIWKSTIEISKTSTFPLQEHDQLKNQQLIYRRRLHFFSKDTIDLEINNRNIDDVYISCPRTRSI